MTFERRGFHSSDHQVRARLEGIGEWFLYGYHRAIDASSAGELGAELSRIEPDVRGFAFEGAGMGLALLDRIAPWRRNRLSEFVRGPGSAHSYLIFVGAGWALARLRLRMSRSILTIDPILGWLAMDGYGFHEGYFNPRRTVEAQRVPSRLDGYARRGFDQGVGRSLWFVNGADAERVVRTIQGFSPARAEDLWSGVGLAAAYAGACTPRALELLVRGAGPHVASLAQGAAFAAKARASAGNLAPQTEAACLAFCGVGATEAAAVTDTAGPSPDASDSLPLYEHWRTAVRRHFTTNPR